MRSIAIVNQKGGSGKTTTAVNLAACLADRGRSVLVFDLDPQSSLSTWYGVTQGNGDNSLNDIIGVNSRNNRNRVNRGNGDLSDIITQSDVSGVYVVSADYVGLVALEQHLTRSDDTGALKHALTDLPGRWDYILFDCPPSLGYTTLNALTAAREVLVPVEAHVMALAGLVQLRMAVDLVNERWNPDLEISGILACRVDVRTRHSLDVVDALREEFGRLVFKTIIRENVRLAECPSFGQPITEYAPGSHGAEDYRAMTREVMKQERTYDQA